MNEKPTNNALNKIRQEWKYVNLKDRPWGVWITQHEPIAETVTDGILYLSPITRAWFLADNEVKERNVWEFCRFITVQGVQPWCSKLGRESTGIFSGGTHEIGLAAFAQYEGRHDLYLEMIWGGRNGRGMRVFFTEQFDERYIKELWIA